MHACTGCKRREAELESTIIANGVNRPKRPHPILHRQPPQTSSASNLHQLPIATLSQPSEQSRFFIVSNQLHQPPTLTNRYKLPHPILHRQLPLTTVNHRQLTQPPNATVHGILLIIQHHHSSNPFLPATATSHPHSRQQSIIPHQSSTITINYILLFQIDQGETEICNHTDSKKKLKD